MFDIDNTGLRQVLSAGTRKNAHAQENKTMADVLQDATAWVQRTCRKISVVYSAMRLLRFCFVDGGNAKLRFGGNGFRFSRIGGGQQLLSSQIPRKDRQRFIVFLLGFRCLNLPTTWKRMEEILTTCGSEVLSF